MTENNELKLDFIGIGVGKCGTTWLSRCLSDHPDIFLPSAKEIEFFVSRRYNKNYQKGMSWYESFFKNAEKCSKKGEISTTYYVDATSPGLIRKAFPNIKLFVCLRDPVDMLYSTYWWRKSMSLEGVLPDSFEEYVFGSDEFVGMGNYYKNLLPYFNIFDKENIKVILLNDIMNAPEDTIREVYKFLGVDDGYVPSVVRERINKNRKKRSELIFFPIRYIIFLLRALGISTDVRRMIFEHPLLEKVIYGFVYKPFKYPRVRGSTRKRLTEYFKRDTKNLEKLTRRDLSHWRI